MNLKIDSAVKQRDLFKRYCDGEDALNDEVMITSAPFVLKEIFFILFILMFSRRTASKRSVDDLPGEEGTKHKSSSVLI